MEKILIDCYKEPRVEPNNIRFQMFLFRYPFTPDQTIQDPDWEVFLKQTATSIIEQQTPKR